MTTTALVTDSTSYLPPGLAAELAVTVVPLHVTLGVDSEAALDGAPGVLGIDRYVVGAHAGAGSVGASWFR